MENSRKSFFNEIGFKPTIEKLVDLTAKLYLEDDNPWVVGYSGGKDSSACLQLMWRVLEKIKSENKPIKPLHVITTDTLVENPGGELAEFYGVRIKTGKYADVIVVYGAVSVKENKDKTNAKLSFNYNIQDPADHDYEFLQKDEDFNNYLGALLQHIIMDTLENKEARIGNKTSTTNTYTE